MRTNGLAIAIVAATAFLLLVPGVQAERVDCHLVAEVYRDSIKWTGVCQDGWGVCLDFYLMCDGQPWPVPWVVFAEPDPGHLVNPPPRLAALSQAEVPRVALVLDEAVPGLSLTSSCESDRLFESLDRRPAPKPAEPESLPKPAVGRVAATPALP
ncbi:MAG: hypothetical protein F4X59_18120 [Holophagales bacterium]|nr:hypothetical protein [Holophagales bacterium]MYC12023.1 hypothetical protein [Holophagales bacterium]